MFERKGTLPEYRTRLYSVSHQKRSFGSTNKHPLCLLEDRCATCDKNRKVYMVRLFRVSVPATVLGLLLSELTLLLGCYIFACYWELKSDAHSYLSDSNGIASSAALTLAFVFGAYLSDLYAQLRVRSNVVLLSRVMTILGSALICEALIGYINPDWALPKPVVITGSISALVVLTGWRMLYSRGVTAAIGAQKILFLGSSPLVTTIAEQLRDRPELGIKAIGYLTENLPIEMNSDLPCLGHVDDVTTAVMRAKPDRVVIAMAEKRGRLPMDDLLTLRFAGLDMEEATTLYEEAFGRVCINQVRPSQLLFSTHLGPRRWTVRLQLIYSTLLAAIGMVIVIPVVALAALIVRLTSAGPAFYRQTRVGLNGRHFTVYKLRSMFEDAEARTGAVWASRNDPRITPVGRFLRKSRIDELPQLWNVLKGDMTLVGPRPERPEFVRDLIQQIPFYPHRHCVKPGVTGWAQINFQYGDTIAHTITKLEYDLYYIKNLSPSLDAYIMFQTIKTMLLSRGAQ
jgi:sugar transferase (PEP-CTERM system associated)